jgi:hypothetical protein
VNLPCVCTEHHILVLKTKHCLTIWKKFVTTTIIFQGEHLCTLKYPTSKYCTEKTNYVFCNNDGSMNLFLNVSLQITLCNIRKLNNYFLEVEDDFLLRCVAMSSGIFKWLHFRLHKKVVLYSLQSVNLISYVQIFVQGVQPLYSCELLHGH